ncbi:uncharacterized protein At2g29880-like [Tripterygium wilfordii]|uniref:uncharacterized protein At2g29880-like n=1 Tax=Tripterygium wilfordii TaxID=458696 RepID=UPI0018F7E8DB|nr:uncharacterized protein At2g29880-like [Tripterygium wilfordii]
MGKRKESDESTKRREPATSWMDSIDDLLIDELLNQQQLGQRVDGNFTTNAYQKIVNVLNKNFPLVSMSKDKVKARMRTLKKKFSECYDIFKHGHLSGFAWNPETCKWSADEEVWARLIARNKDAEEWRNKRIRNYHKLEELWAIDRADGANGIDGSKLQHRWRCTVRIDSDFDENDGENDAPGEFFNDQEVDGTPTQRRTVTSEASSPYKGTGSSSCKKGKRVLDGGIDGVEFLATLKACSSDLSTRLEMFEDAFKVTNRVKDVSGTEIFNELESLGLELDEIDEAYTFLNLRPEMLFAFLEYPVVHRKRWLLKELHSFRNKEPK